MFNIFKKTYKITGIKFCYHPDNFGVAVLMKDDKIVKMMTIKEYNKISKENIIWVKSKDYKEPTDPLGEYIKEEN